ncbi:50S ribosomal protein L17 [Candidatus Tremblaya princeps]|uniref:50S ribosomal protein L17 n=1 Tax=Tremblaya princeps TaxID=189385 RepID=A0A143WNG0_TREPR|nr:50S ribosomal protein L17 [Candidatus Tremblaya princeps]
MKHRRLLPKLGRRGSHRRAMLRNLARSLALHGRIYTTLGRAKALRRFAVAAVSLRARYGISPALLTSSGRVSVRKAFRRRGDQAAMCSVALL